MKNNLIKVLLSIFLCSTLLMSCEKDLNLYDQYKDITILYGLINPNDSISYIRIEKAFLSPENIYQIAKIADSNLYPYKLDARLISGPRKIDLDTITIYNKHEGIFYAPKMLVYYANTKDLLDVNLPLQIEVENPISGKKVGARINLHDASDIPIYAPKNAISFERDYEIVFGTINDVRVYQLNMRFHYMEQIPNDTSSRDYTHIDWVFPLIRSKTLFGGERISIGYFGDKFYTNLLKSISPSTELERYHGQMELIINTTDENFLGYYESSQPSNSIVMDVHTYSNIENGYGLFAAISYESDFIRINNQSKTRIRNLEGLNFVGGIPE